VNRLSRFFLLPTATLCALFLTSGCAHRIRLEALPATVAAATIPQSVQVVVPFLALEGADHMPGTGLLEWPAKDLRAAAISYIQKRDTFTSVDEQQGTFTLTIKAWLSVKSRETYHYSLRLESDLGLSGKPPLKSYLVQKEAAGSYVRWTTASDQRPIAEVTRAALDDLLSQIEADVALYRK